MAQNRQIEVDFEEIDEIVRVLRACYGQIERMPRHLKLEVCALAKMSPSRLYDITPLEGRVEVQARPRLRALIANLRAMGFA